MTRDVIGVQYQYEKPTNTHSNYYRMLIHCFEYINPITRLSGATMNKYRDQLEEARSAARSAESAAYSASESAAGSAAYSAARLARLASARSAESAARLARLASAGSAAWSAARLSVDYQINLTLEQL